VLQQERPDLYEHSAERFGHEAGDMAHQLRLGEFLTEWNNSLGCSPMEALAEGRVDDVAIELGNH